MCIMVISTLIFVKCMFILYEKYGGNYLDGVDEDRKDWRNRGMDKLL